MELRYLNIIFRLLLSNLDTHNVPSASTFKTTCRLGPPAEQNLLVSSGYRYTCSSFTCGAGEMRSNGIFLFSRLLLRCEYTRLARTSQKGGGDAVKWNILVFSVVFGVRTCSMARTSQHRFRAGVFLVSAKKGAIIYPGDFFQRRPKC